MAEFVQANLEKMLTELEQLQRIQLLSNEEVKMVIKKRKKFEYKLQKRQKQKNDILAYIKYESSLLNLIAIRRDQSKYMNKKNEIDHAIAKRINKLFRILEHRFAGDLMVWSSHMAFLKEMGWDESIGKIYRRMLQVHPEKANLWISAGRYELGDKSGVKDLENIENARTIFMEGLRFHPTSVELLLESFRLELLFIQRLKEDPQNYSVPEENKDAIMKGEIAEAICRRGHEAFREQNSSASNNETVVEMLTSMLYSAKLLGAGCSLQEYIIKTLLEKFPNEPVTWNTYALVALFPQIEKDFNEKHEENELICAKERSSLQKVRQCCCRFEEGLAERLPIEVPANRQKLLNMYLETMIQILKDAKDTKVCSVVEERMWHLLNYGKQKCLLNEKNANLFQKIIETGK